MSDSNIAERLKTFIEAKGMSYSQFADTCGIPRPSLSQLLTGRNKKMSDQMVGQIHNMFPELSVLWLLFGEGPMEDLRPEAKENPPQNEEDLYDDGLFAFNNGPSESKKIVFSTGREASGQILAGNRLKNDQISDQSADLKIQKLQNKIKELQGQIENLQKNPRKVAHITVYYDDSTFETFYPR